MRKRGRPKKEAAKSRFVGVRLSADEFDELNYLCEKAGISRADFVRKGIRMYSNLLKFGE